jgi:phosphoglycolate phosphatase
MPVKRLLLWDIDGTLISTGAAGHRAIIRATAERFGGDGDLDGVEIAGRTDTGIAQQVLQKYGAPINDQSLDSFLDLYVRLLAEELPQRQGRVLPGVLELLQRAAEQPNTTLGLLTGNLERGAKLKLEHYRLWHFFAFGAFSDDHHDRNELGAFAGRNRDKICRLASRRHRRYRPRHCLWKSVWRADGRGRHRLVVARAIGRAPPRLSF